MNAPTLIAITTSAVTGLKYSLALTSSKDHVTITWTDADHEEHTVESSVVDGRLLPCDLPDEDIAQLCDAVIRLALELPSAEECFDRITNAAGEVRRSFARAVKSGYDEGDNDGEGFEPETSDQVLPSRCGTCSPDLDLYVVGERLIAVADKGGDWAVDITAAVRTALKGGC